MQQLVIVNVILFILGHIIKTNRGIGVCCVYVVLNTG